MVRVPMADHYGSEKSTVSADEFMGVNGIMCNSKCVYEGEQREYVFLDIDVILAIVVTRKNRVGILVWMVPF